ncbi:hypothetical protein A2U01_0057487, partial [Trifolium medium]|nr:hypothetical protein [Trifolium medium]
TDREKGSGDPVGDSGGEQRDWPELAVVLVRWNGCVRQRRGFGGCRCEDDGGVRLWWRRGGCGDGVQWFADSAAIPATISSSASCSDLLLLSILLLLFLLF